MRNVIITGCAGPIIGVLEITPAAVTSWRSCVLCPWHSPHRETSTREEAFAAASLFIAEQSEHLLAAHPEMIEQVRQEAGESAFLAAPPGMVC